MSSGTGEVDNEAEDIFFGDICMLHSLGKQEYNGKKGRIISEMDNGRFLVSFLDGSNRIKVKPINITRVSKRYNDAYAALQRDPGIEVLRRSVELPEAVRDMRHCASLDAVQEGDTIKVSAVPPTALAGPSQNDIERAEEGGAVRRYGQAAVLWAEGIRRQDTRMLRQSYELDDLAMGDPIPLANVLKKYEGSTDDADVLLLRAALMLRCGDLKQALQASQASVEIHPTSCSLGFTHNVQAMLKAMNKQCIPSSAVKGCQRAIKMDPSNENAWLLLLRADNENHPLGTRMNTADYERRLEVIHNARAVWKRDSSRWICVLYLHILALAAKDGTGKAEKESVAEVWAELLSSQEEARRWWGQRYDKEQALVLQVVTSLGLSGEGTVQEEFTKGKRLYMQAKALKGQSNMAGCLALMEKAVTCFQVAQARFQRSQSGQPGSALRFQVGDKVFCRMKDHHGNLNYVLGEVVKLWYREDSWPRDKLPAPYQLRLCDTGILIWVPDDSDFTIRAQKESLMWELLTCEAQAHLESGNFHKAQMCMSSAVEHDPCNREAWLNHAGTVKFIEEVSTSAVSSPHTAESILVNGLKKIPGDAALQEMLESVRRAGPSRERRERAEVMKEQERVLQNNSRSEALELLPSMRRCALPGCTVRAERKQLKVCARCQVVMYCCKEHQKADWKVHKRLWCVAAE